MSSHEAVGRFYFSFPGRWVRLMVELLDWMMEEMMLCRGFLVVDYLRVGFLCLCVESVLVFCYFLRDISFNSY